MTNYQQTHPHYVIMALQIEGTKTNKSVIKTTERKKKLYPPLRIWSIDLYTNKNVRR